LGIILFLYLLFRFTGPKGVVTSLKESSNKYDVAHWLEELARALGTFKLAGVSPLPLLRIDKLIMGYLHYRRLHFDILILQFKILVGFKVISVGVLLVLGSVLLLEQQISLGQFVAVEIIIILIMNSVDKLIVGLDSVYDLLTSLEKLGSIFDLKLEEDSEKKSIITSKDVGFAVAAQGLTFKYPSTERNVIDNLSFSVPSGSKTALVGLPGSGKSTLLQVLSGIYENYAGRITYNEIPLTALRNDMLRLQIGDNIWQETIFKGTLRENITLGRENISDKMILDSLEVVSATGELNFLDDGLNTIMLPGGTKLTKSFGGRIMLARSIVANPQLILLELDLHYMRLEEINKFFDFLHASSATLIAVTNNEDFLQRCDQIIFMHLGTVLFAGNYKDFKNSEYAKSIK
jgi:ABC-type bacteriocin/lantibiotic exporter with double-glycine peptidase domain